ncbi:hypothetical protein [Pseudobacteriovorax antillogorgiicola]|uniref:Uncharacterized protein n=1 Tax=Pseudobacteriovorax antillogorgiicola TaxID=1513793 RepID=A0A1Y6C307_9BACT|nr:hypothetical protein [Pseudobacteriovorax antillogorgiicola]TCS50757.1 hypothetical protein EDD56_112140 [Pseudobacteriovorax antillogorgiicola]SMF41150.1 hypothetical protein SAMN06296036_112139 [Pseudobacteriovorax antillogorgiicola]
MNTRAVILASATFIVVFAILHQPENSTMNQASDNVENGPVPSVKSKPDRNNSRTNISPANNAKEKLKHKAFLLDSPTFRDYAESSNFFERFDGLRASMNLTLSSVVSRMNLNESQKDELRSKVDEMIQSNRLKEQLLVEMERSFSKDELRSLAEIYRNSTVIDVTTRERELLAQGPDAIQDFLSNFPNKYEAKALRSIARKRVEDLDLWEDTRILYDGMMRQLEKSMELEKHNVSSKMLQQVSQMMLHSQKESFDLAVLYLYQDIDAEHWPKFVKLYKGAELTKERQLMHAVLGKFMEDIASTMGTYTSNVARERTQKNL